jgi:hypothetical protein
VGALRTLPTQAEFPGRSLGHGAQVRTDKRRDSDQDRDQDSGQDRVTPDPPADNTDATEAPDEAGDPGSPDRDLTGAGEPGMREQQP